jgi:hypothetical protein
LKEFTELFHERQNKEEVLIEVLINVFCKSSCLNCSAPLYTIASHRIAQARSKKDQNCKKKEKICVRAHRIKSAESI